MNEGIISRYWTAYGGFKALFTSPYLYTALALSGLMAPAWLYNPWHEIVLSVIPSVLGFSLGGYALLIAVGDEDFRALISGEDEDGEPSPYMEVNAAFVHFILMLLLSLIFALFANAYYFKLEDNLALYQFITEINFPIGTIIFLGNFIGYSVFIYALLLAVAATLAILRVSSWYDHMHTERLKTERLKQERSDNS